MGKILLIVAALIIVLGGGWWLWATLNAPISPPRASVSDSASTSSTTPAVSQATTTITATSTNQKNTMPSTITQATLHTNMGDITFAFLPQQAPNTVANFIKLAQSGFYNGTKFHRVIQGFMDQGGDPLTKDDSKMALWGTGGPGYTFDDEIGPSNNNSAGAVAMANSGPNTNGSQFFINAVNNPSLNSAYTVFGQVTAGMDVVTAINNVPVDSSDRPLSPVIVESVTLN